MCLMLGHFLGDLAALIDRGVLCAMVAKILAAWHTAALPPVTGATLRLLLLRTLVASPLYLPMSRPHVHTLSSPASAVEDWAKMHGLAGLVLREADECLQSLDSSVCLSALHVLQDALALHARDARCQSPAARNALAALYFPFIVCAVKAQSRIENHFSRSERESVHYVLLSVLQDVPSGLLAQWWAKETERRLNSFFNLLKDAATLIAYRGHIKVSNMRSEQAYALLVEARDKLPRLFVNASTTFFGTEEQELGEVRKDKAKKAPKGRKLVETNGGQRKDPVLEGAQGSPLKRLKGNVQAEREVRLEQALCLEADCTLFATCTLFINQFAALLSARMEVFEEVFDILVAILRKPQPVALLPPICEALALLAEQHAPLLFDLKNAVCGELVFETLRSLSRRTKATRSAACTLYVSLIESDIACVHNMSRMRLQTTIGVTRLAGERSDEGEDHDSALQRLQGGYARVKQYFATSSAADGYGERIADQVAVLESKVRTVIADQSKLNALAYDSETIASLYVKISAELRDSPDERIAWLSNLAEFHREKQNLEEAAQTKMVLAALVFEYLDLIGRWEASHAPQFELVCPNIGALLDLPDEKVLAPLESEICQAKVFSEDGFVQLLQEALGMLRQGGFYESCVAAYQVLLPIFQAANDYARLRKCYADLVELTGILLDESQIKQRIFANYYRVAFFGTRLGDLDGHEYVYKELNTTMLAQFTEKILVRCLLRGHLGFTLVEAVWRQVWRG